MGRPSDVAEFVRQGKTPTEIATKLGLSINTVEGYLHRAVGEGLLRRSDIYFSVAKARRKTDRTLGNWYTNPQHALGDMYEDIRRIELKAHERIREALIQSYGDGDAGWCGYSSPKRAVIPRQFEQ